MKSREFKPGEITDFLSARRKDVNFNLKEIKLIKETAGSNPFHLRIACECVFENRGKKWNREKLKKEIKTDIAYYDYKSLEKKRDFRLFSKTAGSDILKKADSVLQILKIIFRL